MTSRPSLASVLLAALVVSCGGDGGDRAASSNPAAVESGLRLAVSFEGEDSTYTVGERMRHHGVPGLSFTLIDAGEIAWSRGYGVKRRGGSDPVEPTTLFQAASVSKALVAAATLRMRDAGLLELDADVESYLGDYDLPAGEQGPTNPVTLRRLLSHTAGITPGGFRGYARGAPRPTDLQVVQGTGPANSPGVRVEMPPGERVAYSGGGYTLVEMAVQEVTDRPFTELMERWILSPAGMENSTFAQPLAEGLEDRAARGHRADGSVVPGGWRVHPEQASAGLWSTSLDLARFAVALRRAYLGQGDLLEGASAREMLSEVKDGHGIAVVLRGEGTARAFSHAGGNEGYRAYLILHLDSGDGAAFMTNSDRGMALGRELLRAAAAVEGWPGFESERYERASVPRDSLRSLEGRYRFGEEVEVQVALPEDGPGLSVTFPNGDTYELVPVGSERFVHPETAVTVDFGWRDDHRSVTIYGDQGVRVEGDPGT